MTTARKVNRMKAGLDDPVAAAFAKRHMVVPSPKQPGYWSWNSPQFPHAIIRDIGDWLTLAAPCSVGRVAPGQAGQWESLLAANEALPAGASLGLVPGSKRAQLRIDVPQVPHWRLREPAERLITTIDAVGRCGVLQANSVAGKRLRATNASDWDTTSLERVAQGEAEGELGLLESLLFEGNWHCERAEEDRLKVRLNIPETIVSALCEPLESGEVRISVDLALNDDLTPESRQAVALLLLRATDAVRLARATCSVTRGVLSPRWETLCTGPLAAAELSHNLAALTVACRLTLHEVRALCDPVVAKKYSRLRGSSS